MAKQIQENGGSSVQTDTGALGEGLSASRGDTGEFPQSPIPVPQHSPLPWSCDEDGDPLDADGYLIAICATQGQGDDEANARLIVRAVNSHYALLDLLAAAKMALGDPGVRTIAALESAIAKAEAK